MNTKIAKTFIEHVSDASQDVDRQLLEIRNRLEQIYGHGFQYWVPQLREL